MFELPISPHFLPFLFYFILFSSFKQGANYKRRETRNNTRKNRFEMKIQLRRIARCLRPPPPPPYFRERKKQEDWSCLGAKSETQTHLTAIPLSAIWRFNFRAILGGGVAIRRQHIDRHGWNEISICRNELMHRPSLLRWSSVPVPTAFCCKELAFPFDPELPLLSLSLSFYRFKSRHFPRRAWRTRGSYLCRAWINGSS